MRTRHKTPPDSRELSLLIERQKLVQEYHTDPSGLVRPDLWIRGLEDSRRMDIAAGIEVPGSGPGELGVTGVYWRQIGPAPIRVDPNSTYYQGLGPDSGEVTDIAIDPSGTSDQIIFIATNDGGIWKSTDGGASWTPKTDGMPSLSMGAVALDPGNPSIVYAGTGNLFDGGATFTKAVGIYRSIDGGETWRVLGGTTLANVGVNRIVLPAAGTLLVATNIGLYRSVDGGQSFGNNAPAYNNGAAILNGFVSGLALDTGAPATTVYAAVSGQGLFKSTDAGTTFPTNLFSVPTGPAPGYFFVDFAQSTQPNGQTIVAYVQASPARELYISTDGGSTWVQSTGVAALAAQLGYDQTLGIDPQTANRVYIAFRELWVSTSGGMTFINPPASRGLIHWDHHAMVFSPRSHWSGTPTRIYVGTDGGIARSSDGGTTWSNINEGIATNLFQGIDIGRGTPTNSQWTFGGCQDTGLLERRPSFPAADWHMGANDDGGPVAVDPWNPQRVYGIDNGGYTRTIDGGSTWAGVPGSGLPGGLRGFAVNLNSNNIVYAFSGTRLYQSTNFGDGFTAIKTFPTPIASVATLMFTANVVWVGLSDGSVQRTDNALAGAASAWTAFSTGLPAGRPASGIAVDPSDSTRVAVCYAGFSAINPANRTQHCYLTTNNGGNWTDISGTDGGTATQNLPDLPLHSIAIDANPSNGLIGVTGSGSLYVAVGLFGAIVTSPDGVTWTPRASGTSATLVEVRWTGSQFVVVGLGGTILTSPDGVAWTVRRSGPTWEALQGIAWSGSTLVATSASSPTVYTSPDGVAWTELDSVAPDALLDVAWGARFVAVGYTGTIVTSPDGTVWTARSSGTTTDLVCVRYAGGQFVAGGLNGTILTSPDGITWTARASGTSNEIDGLDGSSSLIAAVINDGSIITSPDGATWTSRSGPGRRLLDITYSGGQFVAVGDFDTILTSTDGTTWTARGIGAQPTTIIVASDATVMRTIDSGATWQVLGVGIPTVYCKSLALDPAVSPSVLRVGTYGRSVFELDAPSGQRLFVLANLAYGRAAVGSSATLVARLFNVGSNGLTIVSITRTAGSSDFSTVGFSGPASIPPGGELDVTVRFQPTAPGDRVATFTVTSDDVVNPTQQLPVSGSGF